MAESAFPKWTLLENFFMYALRKIIRKIAFVFTYSDIFKKENVEK